MPLTIATFDGSSCISARVIWIDRRMPKSPQPGHQSLCTSVWKSATLRTGLDAIREHLLPGGLPLRDGSERLSEFRARHRPPVVLEDVVGRLDPRLLPDEAAHVGAEVHLDVDDGFRAGEGPRHQLDGERIHEADLEEPQLDAIPLERVDRVEERALRRAPRNDDGLRRAVPEE